VGGIIRVEGHTDNVPIGFSDRFRSNWDLSSARSASVANYILDSTELEPGRLSISGFADSKPIASNDTFEGRAKNRRIEVIVDG
jgi:chemotaxis protein MotB